MMSPVAYNVVNVVHCLVRMPVHSVRLRCTHTCSMWDMCSVESSSNDYMYILFIQHCVLAWWKPCAFHWKHSLLKETRVHFNHLTVSSLAFVMLLAGERSNFKWTMWHWVLTSTILITLRSVQWRGVQTQLCHVMILRCTCTLCSWRKRVQIWHLWLYQTVMSVV